MPREKPPGLPAPTMRGAPREEDRPATRPPPATTERGAADSGGKGRRKLRAQRCLQHVRSKGTGSDSHECSAGVQENEPIRAIIDAFLPGRQTIAVYFPFRSTIVGDACAVGRMSSCANCTCAGRVAQKKTASATSPGSRALMVS